MGKSSTIKEIKYNSAKQELEVEFHSGGSYRYREVPEEAHEKFRDAESQGSHFHREIKPKYRCVKIEKAQEPVNE